MMIFTNPLINSYKRLAAGKRGIFQPEFQAAAWEDGTDKVVRFSEDKEGNCRITALYPDPAANPYLALAAITAAGIDGIVQKASDGGPRWKDGISGDSGSRPEGLTIYICKIFIREKALQDV